MKNKLLLGIVAILFGGGIGMAQCPSFPGVLYSSLVYNQGCIPWDLEFDGDMHGNLTGAYFQWYRYDAGTGSSATATPCDWQTDHTSFYNFKPATDELNSHYIYFCKVTTTACPAGVTSGNFDVRVGSNGDPCPTFAGVTFTITSGGSYTSGQTVTITANTNAYGGDHIYTWYHNGVELDPNDPRYTFVWGFNQPQLIITNVTPDDGGTYSVSMQDGSVCILYTDPVSILVDNPDCGPNPTLTITGKKELCAGDNTTLALTNNTLAPGETGSLVYMLQPAGSHPSTTAPGNWTTDLPGLYQFKYVVDNPANESCYRESKVVSVTVYDGGDNISITPASDVILYGQQLTFTASAPGEGETGKVTFTSDDGQSGDIYPNTYPDFAHTCWKPGTYTYTYTITNTKAGCTRTAQCTVVWYQCEWGDPQWGKWYADNLTIQVGTTIDLQPRKPTVNGIIGVFSYTIDGGEPIVIDPNQPFTPTTPGTYVFTWEYKHSDPRVTDCHSAITKTFIVQSCGSTATIATDKTVLILGESATLTLSTPEAGETAKLSYTKDGGSATTLAGNTFTPTEPGTYVITYSITTVSCGTNSQSITIHVYACGPEAVITIPVTEIQLLRSTTITLSQPGNEETATLTISKNGGTPVPLTIQPSPFVWQATELGTFVFTYSITHPMVDCSRTATATIKVIEAELVFDDHNGTHRWSDQKNWWPSYNRIPTATDSVIIQKPCNVDMAQAVTRDLVFNGGTITIEPTGALLIRNKVLQYRPNAFHVLTDATGNGALVLGPDNTDIQATVSFFSRAEKMNELYPVWQYMGSPVHEQLNIAKAYPQATFYQWTNTPNNGTGGNWQRLDSLNGALMPFTGYCMTQTQNKTYVLQGTLNDPVMQNVQIPYNDQGPYPGFAFVANSWVAPISIANMDLTDFGAADATVYIMNAGTNEEAVSQQGNASANGTGTARGQYNTIPVHAASYLPGTLTVIPPMQGFFVHTPQATTLQLDYTKSVYTPALTQLGTTPMRLPAGLITPEILHLRVQGFGAEDEVFILTNHAFSTTFDNGWDGYKARSERSAVSMAVLSENGPMAVAALPEIEGTEILFEGGNHKTYTLTAKTNRTTDNLFLQDLLTGDFTPLTDGASYTFKNGAGTRRFVITTRKNPTEQDNATDLPVKYLDNGILYIRIGDRRYNATSQLVQP